MFLLSWSYIFAFFLFISLSIEGLAQQRTQVISTEQKTDSLLKALSYQKADSSKLKILEQLIQLNSAVDPSSAFLWIDQAMKLAKETGNSKQLIEFELYKLNILGQQGELIKCIELSKTIKDEVLSNGIPDHQATFWLIYGGALLRYGELNEASFAFRSALEIARLHRLPAEEVKAGYSLALLYDNLQNYEQMKTHLQYAYSLAAKFNLENEKAQVLQYLGLVESRLNNYGKAADYTSAALGFYENTADYFALGSCYNNLSWCFLNTGDYSNAFLYAKKSLDMRLSINDIVGVGRVYQNMGKIFLETNEYDSALIYIKKGLTIALEKRKILEIRDCYFTLAKALYKKGNYKEAYENLKQHVAWRDSVRRSVDDKLIASQLAFYNEQYADSLRKAGVITHKEARKKVYDIYWFFLIGLLLGVLVTYIVSKLKQTSSSAITVTERANHEDGHSTNARQIADELEIQLSEKSLQISQLMRQLENLEKELRQQTATDLSELRQLVQKNQLQSESYWNEFLFLFSKVYPEFFERLKERFPTLNQNEMRMCALIKLGLSQPDIANALSITTDGVRKARYRLYKKLGFQSDADMADHILSV